MRFALGAAVCWAAYILLTQQVGDRVTGLSGLAISMPVAGIVAMLAAASPGRRVTLQLLPPMLGLAVLHPVVPFSLEFLALRRLTASSFGTLMSLEPAIALLAGLLVLGRPPAPPPPSASSSWSSPASAPPAPATERPGPTTTATPRLPPRREHRERRASPITPAISIPLL